MATKSPMLVAQMPSGIHVRRRRPPRKSGICGPGTLVDTVLKSVFGTVSAPAKACHRRGDAIEELGHGVEAPRLVLPLEPLHRLALGAEPLHGIEDAHVERRDHHRDQVAERAALVGPAHAHRAHRAQLEPLGPVAARAEVAAEGAGEDGEDHVVHGAAQRLADRAHLRER